MHVDSKLHGPIPLEAPAAKPGKPDRAATAFQGGSPVALPEEPVLLARGVVWALVLSAPLWAIIAAVIWLI